MQAEVTAEMCTKAQKNIGRFCHDPYLCVFWKNVYLQYRTARKETKK